MTRSLVMFVNLGSKMKLNLGVVDTFRVQEPIALCEIHDVTIFIFTDIRRLKPREFYQFFGILTG